jgi:glycosyltransferase involved in cell wall biosynthesis
LLYSLVAYIRLARKIKEFKPVGIYERYNLYLLAGVWAKRRFGLPLILEVNAPMAQERRKYGGLSWPTLADWVERYVWCNADIVVPVTRVLADYAVSVGVQSHRIVVIPNGIDLDNYQDLPSQDEAKHRLGLSGKTIIGFTGFVREWDRLDRVVRWLATARDGAGKDAHLLVIGDGPARATVEECARECGVHDRVTFTGIVARAQVPAMAMAFDIALQTALVPYASPLCLFEYMGLSKAIVAPDQPNHLELLTNGVNAILYDPQDERGIEKALESLCVNADLRQHLASNVSAIISEKGLTWMQHAAKVKRLFEESMQRTALMESKTNG